ncbi:MAG: phosphoribosylaminoimidazolesuccinocarboxamide synthase [Planctomycetes bacterium]|nr:phosphoribosylaminoimidazolesuccinocarboxamide synthase [Planctomycetota bacterium]
MASVPNAISANPSRSLARTELPLPNRREGKIRDIYSLPAEAGKPPRLLIVATDRISAFDVVLPTPIPGKGRLLTEISVRWFFFIRALNLIADHLVSTDPIDLPRIGVKHRSSLEGRMMICRAAEVIPIEFVIRGYLAGSGWIEYQEHGSICGVRLPGGLRCGDKLPEPIFTPTTKASSGHDEAIDYERACAVAGRAVIDRLRNVALRIYGAAAGYALSRRVILADTKFEFGYAVDEHNHTSDELILIDEVLTPDSSRYWPTERYQPGREQDNFDKQYVRNHLLGLVEAGRWDKTSPGPDLPPQVVADTVARYVEVRDRLFGSDPSGAGS